MDGCKYGGGPKMAKKYDGKLYYIYIYTKKSPELINEGTLIYQLASFTYGPFPFLK